MNEYHFSAELAQRYGLDEAIMLHNLAYWVQKNTLDGRHIYDGRAWTYNSQESFTGWFPFWSKRQVQRILKSLEDQGLIVKGNYNKKAMDKTLWYSLSDSVLDHYGIHYPPSANGDQSETRLSQSGEHQTVPSIAPNRAMESTEPCHPQHETVPAIPKSKHKEKPKETRSAGAGADQQKQFDQFWDRYPRKEGKKKAWESWRKLNPDPVLFTRIMTGLNQHIRSEQWQRGVIPHPTTWLNGERWNDELTLAAARTAEIRSDSRGGSEYV